ncbi:MAG: chromosomal replication initiator protein DnaA [Pseudomonadota bacterium]
MTTIWEELKHQIKTEMPEKSFSLWIYPLSLMEQKGDILVLGCPNKFSLNWITENYLRTMEEKLEKTGEGKYKIALRISKQKKTEALPAPPAPTKQLLLPGTRRRNGNGGKWLNREFTFDRFVVGKCNEFAYSASKALALGNNWPYNHLYILAATGLGKSHLSQAIGHAILEQNPAVRVCYITAEDFINEMIHALKSNSIEAFKNKYRRGCDVLLLEEVHFLSGKEKTQLELEYTLDALANENKKLIFTSSLLPDHIPNLTKELSSRLTSGIITTLEAPDYETRVKILQKKASEQNLPLSDEIIHIFSKYLSRDVRQMESALRCLKAKSELLNVKVDLDLAKEVLKSQVPDQHRISIEGIKNLVCKYFKVDPVMLRSKSRKRIHSYPRNIYIYLCRRHTDTTVEVIGSSINRNHSTVLYASESIEQKMKLDRKVRNQVNFLEEKLRDIGK